MRITRILSLILLGCWATSMQAIEDPTRKSEKAPQVSEWRAACTRPTNQYDMQINNVRSRMHVGGHVWSDAAYIVPKPAPGELAVSALYAGGVWIGGRDRAGNIKLTAATYRSLGFDFFSGPLDIQTGATEFQICKDWDRFFIVKGSNILNTINQYDTDPDNFDCESLTEDVRYWPAQGNPYFNEKFSFTLLDQPLANYWDEDGSGDYDPCKGDFPIIDLRGCEPVSRTQAKELVPDEMVFWIYNDNGGPHTLSGPAAIQMEVQVQAFAYATNDAINDMTFYRYKLINKATEDIGECYFSIWIDPDLGCYQDDYIGCDVSRSLAYVYNEDAVDGINNCDCTGTPTYCTTVPILGMDYFRGPRAPKVFLRDSVTNQLYYDTLKDENGEYVLDQNGNFILNKILSDPKPFSGEQDTLVELGMTSFMYAENCGVGSPNPNTCDPQRGNDEQFYNYIRGLWLDGNPLTYGGTGYNPGATNITRYAFPDDPNNRNGWSMCTTTLPNGDRRTMQATGPLTLQPGATNELIMGVVFVPDLNYPCPDITRLKFADDIAQALFDNCFDIPDGPDAPDVTAIELDRELILLLSNEATSNNFNEGFKEKDLQAPIGVDSLYRFEGYKVYQLANGSVTTQELGDINKARLIQTVDVKNGVKELYNWTGLPNPLPSQAGNPIWTYTKRAEGTDQGLSNTFRILEDQFAVGDQRLVNHKEYHFLVLAYAYNNWADFDAKLITGQATQYLEGRKNIGPGGNGRPYTLVPRPIVYENLNAQYGDGPVVTRLAGEGNPHVFLDMDPSMYDKILSSEFNGEILYKSGFGPINAKVVDPLSVKDGKYKLDISGEFNFNRERCEFSEEAIWSLTDISTASEPKVLLADKKLADVREYILNNLGFSITMNQVDEPGTKATASNGAIDGRFEYASETEPKWFRGITDGGVIQSGVDPLPFVDFIRNLPEDPTGALSRIGTGMFVPFFSTKFEPENPLLSFFLSPAAREQQAIANNQVNRSLRFRDLNNVDIVFTKDKSKWSKCIVLETASPDYYNNGLTTIGDAKNFELRQSPSVGPDGLPLNDNTVGFGYFPGYAVDVETGKRLNVFFGENSVYSGDNAAILDDNNPIGGDMIYNPSAQLISDQVPNTDPRAAVVGGQHYIYVTRQEYDGCAALAVKLRKGASTIQKLKGVASITWTAFPLGIASSPMTSVSQGLIPNDLTVKLRVDNPYGQSRKYNIEKERDCETFGDNPSYTFEFKGVQSKSLVTQEEYQGALANVNVVPNPYYAYSAYETSQFTNIIKITNLPERAIVTIYTIDGQFVQQFNRDERKSNRSGNNRPTSTTQVYPDLTWDMKNSKGIPVASGVYLIHINAPELGEERTLKWFGIGRQFDPNGL